MAKEHNKTGITSQGKLTTCWERLRGEDDDCANRGEALLPFGKKMSRRFIADVDGQTSKVTNYVKGQKRSSYAKKRYRLAGKSWAEETMF